MLAIDLGKVSNELILPEQGYYADRERLARGIYFTCEWKEKPADKPPKTVRIARPGLRIDFNQFSKIGTIGIEQSDDGSSGPALICPYVGIDIDNKDGTADIGLVIDRLRGTAGIEVRRSTGGAGLHVYVSLEPVLLVTKPPDVNDYDNWKKALEGAREEYRVLKERVEQWVRDALKDTVPIDAVGGINAMWMYTSEPGKHGTPFELLLKTEGYVVPDQLPPASAYSRSRRDTASPRPRMAPGLPKYAAPKVIRFIEALSSWRPREVPDSILGHFHLSELREAMYAAGIAGWCSVKTGTSDPGSPNAYLLYHNDGRDVHDYVVCALNGTQPLWEDGLALDIKLPEGHGRHPRLVLGTVTLVQLESLDLRCPDATRLNGRTEIEDDVQYRDMERSLCLHPLSEYNPTVTPYDIGQRGKVRCPGVEWRPGVVTIRHSLGPSTAQGLEESSGGFWSASARGVSCPIRLSTGAGVVPKSSEHVVFNDDLCGLLYKHFCMIDPQHVNTGNRMDMLFCAPYYMRGSEDAAWQPITTNSDLTASLVYVANINAKSASRARQVLRDQRVMYLTHDMRRAQGRYGKQWNIPLNIHSEPVVGRSSGPEVALLERLSGTVKHPSGEPYLLWWLAQRISQHDVVLPNLHFKSAINAATFRACLTACFMYPCVYNITPGTRLTTLPIRTLCLYSHRLIEEIPSPADRVVTIRDSAGPLTTYSVILSTCAHGVKDDGYNVILEDVNDSVPSPYMADWVRKVIG